MPRHIRKYYQSEFFHVMVQGLNREKIFLKNNYKKAYLKMIKEKLDARIIIADLGKECLLL